MYKYEEPSIFSGPRGVALIAVIILHIVVGWAFYTGLAGKLDAERSFPPVEIAQIDKPKEVDKPPPPPPKLEEVKPFVPPPEFVDIQAPQQETNAIIADHASAKTGAGRRAGARAAPGHPSRMDPKHPLHIGEDYYPDASKRAGEEGRCIVRVTIAADGRITNAAIQQARFSAAGRGVLEGRARPAHEARHRRR